MDLFSVDGSSFSYLRDWAADRIVRVEEGIKTQQELMRQGFELMDRRLESFEGRFNRITAIITVGFAAMAVLMSVYQFLTWYENQYSDAGIYLEKIIIELYESD